MKDYYALLGVPATATVSEIHKAYWHKASRYHPDRGGRHEDMVLLVEAWKILSDPVTRARYDQLRALRHDGWRNRKFNADVINARKRAEGDAASSWAEFEAIYQKAFYAFNRDFYGEDIDRKAAGPYSPLMVSRQTGEPRTGKIRTGPARPVFATNSLIVASLLKSVILFAAVVAALVFYRDYLNVGRYVPVVEEGTSHVLVLDTINGTLYPAGKQDGSLTALWKQAIPLSPERRTATEKRVLPP